MKRLVSLLIASTLLVLTLAYPASARRVEGGSGQFDETLDEVVCGVPVTTHSVGRFSFLVKEIPGNSLPLFQEAHSFRVTWTKADGDSLNLFVAGLSNDVSIVQNEDGTTTFTFAESGIPEMIRDSEGNVVTKDVGRIVFADTWDLSDPENPIFISGGVVSVAGPHPEADSDFALFCEIFVAELG
jgi:hypothetical protein